MNLQSQVTKLENNISSKQKSIDETAVKLAFTSAGKKLSLAASEKTLELTRPYACMTTIFFSAIRVFTCDGVIDFLVQDSVGMSLRV